MAGYGLKSFLIAQSLNQIEKAYGPNNSILDNCHVRVSFATNDERTAKRVSDALGTATEMRAMKNYAGHRLSPWLGHLMVSRSETARPLLTPGEIMQLPPERRDRHGRRHAADPGEEGALLRGCPLQGAHPAAAGAGAARRSADDWSKLPLPARPEPTSPIAAERRRDDDEDPTESERRHQPELSRVKPVEKKAPIDNEFEIDLPTTTRRTPRATAA
jgi:type IV secretion system protein VirD4